MGANIKFWVAIIYIYTIKIEAQRVFQSENF